MAFWTIVRHEWRVLAREGTTWAALLLLAICVFVGASSGAAWTRAQGEAMRQGQSRDRKAMSELQAMARRAEITGKDSGPYAPERSPGHLSVRENYRRFAGLPPAPLGALSIGQNDVNPLSFRLNIARRDAFLGDEELENPLNLLAGRFDLAFVLTFIVPLVALALSFNLLSGERESGTLRLLLSQGTSRGALLMGKITARVLLLWAATLGLSLAALLLFGALRDAPFALILLWAATTMSYIAFWVVVAGAVNATGGGSAANAMLLGGAYLLLVLLMPSGVNVWTVSRHPIPSRVEMVQIARDVDTHVRPRTAELIEAYYRAYPGSRPANFDPEELNVPLQHAARQREGERLMAPHLARYEAALSAQQNEVNRLRYLSPAVLAAEAFNDLSGSGVARHRRFTETVSQFHVAYRAYFEPRTFRQTKLSSSDYNTMPRFEWREETTGEIARRVLPALLMLALSTLGLSVGSLMLVRRHALAG